MLVSKTLLISVQEKDKYLKINKRLKLKNTEIVTIILHKVLLLRFDETSNPQNQLITIDVNITKTNFGSPQA